MQREIHLLSPMNHHGIMKMVDCYEGAERVHIITEKYTGGELFVSENTSPNGCFSEIYAARIIKFLQQAVDYLHENDIVSDKSDRAKDFIKCLFMRDPSRRLMAKEAFDHPWIAKNTHCERTIAKDDNLMARIQKLRCSIHRLKIWSAAALGVESK